MRRLIIAGLLGLFVSSGAGCLLPMYDGDPNRRVQQLIFSAEDFRALRDEWQRFWFLDQPSHLKPYRTHGGLL